MDEQRPETLDETQKRLALGGVTTAPMMQTLDTAPRKRRSTVAVMLLVLAAIAGVGLLLFAALVVAVATGS
ncbi:hypothetical protein HD599_002920 [Conyzicola lurida]|uniref:Uncharacterized protein n=1 Tax=Conyzicola lurida TaxID=1172621 RepID=A0A841AN36_9MICO|nr:hypothetical protein [Conyzicola lurida]MBB5844597.1 hypothetical protein [Conyzicola lurida]